MKDKEDIKKYSLGFSVVQKLLSFGNYLNKGYHLFTDNFYTSLSLVKALLQKNTYLTGIICRNRKEVPLEAKKANVGEPKYFSHENVMMCSFEDKKNKQHPVILISTSVIIIDTNNVIIRKRRGTYEQEKEKPSMIHDYNKFMGGVDESDKMLYTYLDERRTFKYWKKIAFNIFGRMVLNAYIIYRNNTTNKIISRLQFTSEIISNIENEWIEIMMLVQAIKYFKT